MKSSRRYALVVLGFGLVLTSCSSIRDGYGLRPTTHDVKIKASGNDIYFDNVQPNPGDVLRWSVEGDTLLTLTFHPRYQFTTGESPLEPKTMEVVAGDPLVITLVFDATGTCWDDDGTPIYHCFEYTAEIEGIEGGSVVVPKELRGAPDGEQLRPRPRIIIDRADAIP